MITRLRTALATGALSSALLVSTAATAAADPPNCTAADMAGIMSGVAAATSVYLFTHPDVNAFFTGLKGQPKEQIRRDVQDYLTQNPLVKADLQGIRQPSADFRNRCGAGQ